MIEKVITMTVRNGQVSFDTLPQGLGIQINNYDTGIEPNTYLTDKEQYEKNLVVDSEGDWFHPSFFTDTEIEVSNEAEGIQLEFPFMDKV